jgi:hypothetical protein
MGHALMCLFFFIMVIVGEFPRLSMLPYRVE